MALSCKITFRQRLKGYVFSKLLVQKRFLQNCTVLGIETSCDDTGCAVVNASGQILGESLYSQNLIHLRYGGINPLVARDLHRDNIEQAVEEALERSCMSIKEVDAVAVTLKPGLLVSLQIGVKYGKFLEKMYNKPLIPIHHMEAHALVARMFQPIPFPYIALLISGGHCLLTVVKGVNEFYLLGQSLDIAPGELFDKAARRMKLKNIPEFSRLCGGSAIEVAAKNATKEFLFDFPLPLARYRDCNFSFSGLQDALMHHILNKEKEHGILADGIIPEVANLCASLQTIIAEHIAHRTERAIIYCDECNIFKDKKRNIVVSGGVACNNFIFNLIKAIGKRRDCEVHRPPPSVCTDNGVMIAWNGMEKLKAGISSECFTVNDIDPKAPLGINCIEDVRKANIRVRVIRHRNIMNEM